MRRILLGVVFVLGLSFGLSAQLNDYKYVIVPTDFNGFKKENQYKTSTLIKYLFSQKGFETYYENNLPLEVNADRCKALTVGLEHSSNMFHTSAIMVLKDCAFKVVYTTDEGKSKDKDVEKSYKEAIESAFISIKAMPYTYTPKTNESKAVVASALAVEEVSKETPAVIEQKEVTPPKEPVMVSNAAPTELTTEVPKTAAVVTSASVVSSSGSTPKDVWYAQEIPNGYQLVDSSPKVRLKIYKTETADMYIAESSETNGVVYKRDNKWFFEYYKAGEKKVEELNVKF